MCYNIYLHVEWEFNQTIFGYVISTELTAIQAAKLFSRKLFFLLFADDVALVSHTPAGLQNLVNGQPRSSCL